MKTQNAQQMRFTRFLIFSLVIHGVMAVFLYYAPRLAFMQELARRLDHTIEDKTEDLVTQIELVDEEDLKVQVVSQSDQSVNEKVPEKDYFLSKNNQTVEEETRAAHTGKFNNASVQGVNIAPQAPSAPTLAQEVPPAPVVEEPSPIQDTPNVPKTKLQKLGLTGASLDDLAKTMQAQQAQEGRPGFAGDGLNQTDDHLDEIKIGDKTLLNTREFIYYSYFMRVKEQLRSHWQPQIRHSIQLIYSQDDRRLASADIKSTSLRITLDHKGYLKKVELLKTSGFKELDVAAIEAFRAAAPFLNPPSGIIEKDGTIKFQWDFILES